MNTLLNDNEAQELLERVSVRDPTGRVAVTIGLMATVYFENPWSQEAREAVTELAHRYLEQFSAELRWARHPKTAKMHPIASRHIVLPRDWLPQHEDPETSWEFQFHGGEHERGATPFLISGSGSDTIRKGLGYLHVTFPLRWFAGRSETLAEYLRTICDRLKPVSGYGGIGILESPSIVARQDYQAVVRAMAERFPGLEVDARNASGHHLDAGIKGVNWLTALSDRWVHAIGGQDYLRARLDEAIFGLYPYAGGLIIQAGPKPVIGDVKTNRWPEHYVTLAKLLKPIQIKDHFPMHFGGVGGLEREETLAWLFRFDGK